MTWITHSLSLWMNHIRSLLTECVISCHDFMIVFYFEIISLCVFVIFYFLSFPALGWLPYAFHLCSDSPHTTCVQFGIILVYLSGVCSALPCCVSSSFDFFSIRIFNACFPLHLGLLALLSIWQRAQMNWLRNQRTISLSASVQLVYPKRFVLLNNSLANQKLTVCASKQRRKSDLHFPIWAPLQLHLMEISCQQNCQAVKNPFCAMCKSNIMTQTDHKRKSSVNILCQRNLNTSSLVPSRFPSNIRFESFTE